MSTDEDTETLLALLSSLLTSPLNDQSLLLDALVESGGNVQQAALLINAKAQGKKRKRPNNLHEWLKHSPSPGRKERPFKDDTTVASTSSQSLVQLSSPTKPVVDLMSVLCQPPLAPKIVSRLPPLMLSNPSLVAQHTPCTLHLSVLPPELACRLFYTMIDEARHWQRNKWWLFDKLVESPHRTSFYSREDNGVDGDKTWQESAQYW